MTCARCGEEITAPYFFEGKTYGYTCIKIVNPSAKKKKNGVKEHWVIAESHDFNPELGKQQVTAVYDGRKHKTWFVTCGLSHDGGLTWVNELRPIEPFIELGADNTIYINIAAYKYYWQPDYKAPVAV